MPNQIFIVAVVFLLLIGGCASEQSSQQIKLTFLDEHVIKNGAMFDGTTVGGLSSIDYYDDAFYLVSDDNGKSGDDIKGPARYYKTKIELQDKKIGSFKIEDVFELSAKKTRSLASSHLDPEGLRVHPITEKVIWTSEGSIKNAIPPAIFISDKNNQDNIAFELPKMFDLKADLGPRHNAVFEGLVTSHDGQGVWVAMEGPLKQDGHEANLEQGAVVRISYMGFGSKQLEKQFAYDLAPIPVRPKAKADAFRVTGLVELIQLNESQFIVMERAYTAGLDDGGNNVSLYLADINNASDISNLDGLDGQTYRSMNKKRLLDLNDITPQLKSKRIDNLEGMTLGPVLENGNQSLLLVSDNNFNLYGQQITQVLLFELEIR